MYVHVLNSEGLICVHYDLEWQVNLFTYKFICDYAIFYLINSVEEPWNVY